MGQTEEERRAEIFEQIDIAASRGCVVLRPVLSKPHGLRGGFL